MVIFPDDCSCSRIAHPLGRWCKPFSELFQTLLHVQIAYIWLFTIGRSPDSLVRLDVRHGGHVCM